MTKISLDKLEVMIQLVKINNSNLKKATYKELKEEIDKQFEVDCNMEDLRVLHEATIDELQLDAELLYGNILNYSPNLNF